MRRVVAGVGLGAIVLLGLGGVALWKWREADRHLAEAERQRDLAREQKKLALEGISRLTHDVPQRLRDVPGALPVVRDIVAGNLAMLERVATAAAAISAHLCGPCQLARAYEEARRHGYLWHEFGDSHLILG